jgi:pyruvate ferredoxin oxidoreductase beta subunit
MEKLFGGLGIEVMKMSESLLAPGHLSCAGCGPAIAIRMLLDAVGKDVIVCEATGCMEVVSTQTPLTSWKVPWIHANFENAVSVASGVKAALEYAGNAHTQVIALGGDGGIVDIGFGALSGALERGDDILIVCYDNNAYANTGMQRSGATPMHAATTTTPAGKQQPRKDVPEIVAAHGVAYVATASIAYPEDLKSKLKKAMIIHGPRYIHIHTPCPVGWGFDSSETVEIGRLAVQTGMWQLYEIEHGKKQMTVEVEKKPVKEYLSRQKRFKHLTEKEIEDIQKNLMK